MFRCPAFALTLLLASAAFGAGHSETAASVGMSAERLAGLDKTLQGYVDRQEVPGVVALIARRGKIVYHKSFGHREVESKSPMKNDVIFRIASMTKPIASVALMTLWEEGRFQLRDPISEHLPEFKHMQVAVKAAQGEYLADPYKTIPATHPITFQHVLSHTAGLANTYRGFTRSLYRELGQKRKPDWTIGDYVKELAKLPLNFNPGEAWEYGPGTDVVGRLVEVLSGKTFDQYLKERIFQPLGMTDTHFYLPKSKLPRFVALYEPDERGKIKLTEAPDANSRFVREPHVYFSGGGGLVSTTTDYYRFHQMMLNGGELDGERIIGPRTVRLMTSNHIGDKEVWLRGAGYGFGLGYSIVTDVGQTAMPTSLGTYAWGGAYCTAFWVDPEDELIGILMTQVRPYTHLNIREDIRTMAYQAIIE